MFKNGQEEKEEDDELTKSNLKFHASFFFLSLGMDDDRNESRKEIRRGEMSTSRPDQTHPQYGFHFFYN